MTAHEPPIIAGAEPWSHRVGTDDGPHPGVLVLHGFTGCPQSVRPLAEAFAAAGFHVELPLLPGHGRTVESMIPTRWEHWSAEAEAAFDRLRADANAVVVAGLSMGATLAAWLATRHPEIAGLVLINGALEPLPDEVVQLLRDTLSGGTELLPSIGSDIARPGSKELSYDATPVAALLSLVEEGATLAGDVGSIRCPSLVMTSVQDHVIAPSAGDFYASRVGGPVERIALERSFHVATLDYDQELIETNSVAFAKRVCVRN